MNQTKSIRLQALEKLGELLPILSRKVHFIDYQNLNGVYRIIKANQRNPYINYVIGSYVINYVGNLRSISEIVELYQKDEESRRLLLNAAGILEEIMRS